MKYWKSGLSWAYSEPAYTQRWSPLPIEWRILFRAASSVHSWLSALSGFLATFPTRRFWAQCFLATLLGMGMVYGVSTTYADWSYARGMDTNLDSRQRIEYLRVAAKYNPFNHDERTVGASIMALFALNSNDLGWIYAARAEIRYRLATDSTDAVLLMNGILVNQAIGDTKEAQFYLEQFRRVNKKSTQFKLVAKSHQQGSSAVAPVP